MDFETTAQAAARWGIDASQVRRYCEDGRVPGATKMGMIWLIPKEAIKPQGKPVGGAAVRRKLPQAG